MKTPIKDRLLNSFDNHSNDSFSGRKLSAFTGVGVGIILTFLVPSDSRIYALVVWLLFALLCLGIVTFEQIIKFKNGGNTNGESNTTNIEKDM